MLDDGIFIFLLIRSPSFTRLGKDGGEIKPTGCEGRASGKSNPTTLCYWI